MADFESGVHCTVKDCKHHDGHCGCEFKEVYISEQLTIAGFIPICEDYEDKSEGE